MTEQKELIVGELRQQCALSSSDERVVIIPSKKLEIALNGMNQDKRKIVLRRCYPDTNDEDKNWGGTFKIEADLVEAPILKKPCNCGVCQECNWARSHET